MRDVFLIVGLPRSRTAWLANFLTYGDAFCFHELLVRCSSFPRMKEWMEDRPEPFVGNSDSSQTLYLPQIIEVFPKAKIVVVERDVREVADSMASVGLGYVDLVQLENMQRMIERAKNEYDHLAVRFDDLGDESTCREIWDYCKADEFDIERWRLLRDLNIQIDKSLFSDKIVEAIPNMQQLEINRWQ